jgi:hypothetical protein
VRTNYVIRAASAETFPARARHQRDVWAEAVLGKAETPAERRLLADAIKGAIAEAISKVAAGEGGTGAVVAECWADTTGHSGAKVKPG